MSRTYNTDPYQVRASRHPQRRIIHRNECEYAEHSWSWVTRPVATEPCDVGVHQRSPWLHCRYTLPHRSQWVDHGPNPADRRDYWHGPSRAEERVTLNRLKQDYRANGDIDDSYTFEHEQHHHGIGYYW